jgi:hypothetical protein
MELGRSWRLDYVAAAWNFLSTLICEAMGLGRKEGATQNLNGCFESYLHLIAGHCQWRTLAMVLDLKGAIH